MNAARVRFIAFDVHKQYVVAAGVDEAQRIVLGPRRVDLDQLGKWAAVNLQPIDVVVLEATSSAWDLHDQLQPLVGAVVIANPAKVALIAKSSVKTDAKDALTLARLLGAGLIPTVWVPPIEVRELRGLVAHRQRLIWQRTRIRSRLRAVLQRHNLAAPSGEVFSAIHREWWEHLPLSTTERLRVRHDLALLDGVAPLITESDKEIARLSQEKPWIDQVAYLAQLPGIGLINAMVLLAAIGDVQRFASADQLVGYAGLGASAHHSGQTHYGGHITKQGRRDIRTAMVEAAWMAVRHHPHWSALFQRLSNRLGASKAIVAIARKLLVVAWHVLHDGEADRYAIPEKVARKFVVWARDLGRQHRHGLTRGAFVRQELDRIGLAPELSLLSFGGDTLRLGPRSPRSASGLPGE